MVKTVFDADDDLMVWWLILQTREIMYKARTKELFQYRVTPQESQVLWVIKGLGHAPTPTEISRWLLREPHAISTILKRMEKKGLVRRECDPHKKNVLRVFITKKGLELYPKLATREVVHQVMSVVTEKERQQIRPILKKIRDKSIDVLATYNKKLISPDFLVG